MAELLLWQQECRFDAACAQPPHTPSCILLPICAQGGRLHGLLGQQRFSASAELMRTALQLAGLSAEGQAAAGAAAAGGGAVEASPATAGATETVGSGHSRPAPSQALRQKRPEQEEEQQRTGQRTPARQRRAQPQQQPKPDPEAESALAGLLRGAAQGAAAAAQGLVPELAAAFLRLLPLLGPREQADKVGGARPGMWEQRANSPQHGKGPPVRCLSSTVAQALGC